MITDHEFVSKREWGINPTADKPCQFRASAHVANVCGYPKAQHAPACPGALNIAGEHFACELVAPHDGWGHQNRQAEAIWQ